MANDPKILPSSGVAATQQPQQNQPKRKGTGFTNLQRILQASQGSKLGQTIAGGITGQAQQVQSGVKSAQEQFKKESEAKRVGTEADVANAKNVINQAASGEEITSALPDFQRYLSGQYQGPTQLANQEQLASQAQQAETLGRLASGIGSRSGTGQGDRQQLLRRFAGGADYTSGQRKLDESILARDREANLAAAARQTRGVAQEAQRAGEVAQAQGQEYQNLARQFAKQTSEEIDKSRAEKDIILDEQVRLANQQQEEKRDYIKSIQDKINENLIKKIPVKDRIGQIDEMLENAKKLGVTQEEIDALRGSEPKKNELTTKITDYDNQLSDINNQITQLKNSPEFRSFYDSFKVKDKIAKLQTQANAIEKQKEPLTFELSNLDYISRAADVGLDPYDILAKQMIAKSDISNQATRGGLISQDKNLKLKAAFNALDLLSGKKGTDVEFGREYEQFKPGQLGFSSLPLRQQTITPEYDKTSKELENAKNAYNDIRKQMSVLEDTGRDGTEKYRDLMKKFEILKPQIDNLSTKKDRFKSMLDDINKEIENQQLTDLYAKNKV